MANERVTEAKQVTVRPQRAWPVLGCPPSHPGGETRYGTSSKGRIARCGGARRPSETYCDCGVPGSWGCRAMESGGYFFIRFFHSQSSVWPATSSVGEAGVHRLSAPGEGSKSASSSLACRPWLFFPLIFRSTLGCKHLKGPLLSPHPRCLGRRVRGLTVAAGETKLKRQL